MTSQPKRRNKASWKKVGSVLVTLTTAVTLFQQIERAVVTTSEDLVSFSSPPVTYAQLEALRVKSAWPASAAGK
jgi:hypothetical protein